MPQPDNSLMIFVVGSSRSGTTMMGRVLGRSAEVHMFPELHFFEQACSSKSIGRLMSAGEAAATAARLLKNARAGLFSGGEERFGPEASKFVDGLGRRDLTPPDVFREFLFYEAARHGKSVPCEQTPRNVFYIGEILELYRGAKVINMVRDPRDVLLSQKRKWRRRFLGAAGIPLREAFRSWVNYHPVTISMLWRASVKAASRFSQDTGVLHIRFESLVENPEETVKEVCAFLGVPFEAGMLDIPQVGSSSCSDGELKKGMNRERAGGWKKGGLNSTEVFILQRIAGRWMQRHGYEAVRAVPNPFRLVYYLCTFAAKLSAAFVLNIGRMKDVGEAVRRRLRA